MDKVLAARKFNQGFATTEYLAAAMLDQAWHQLPAGQDAGAGRRRGVRERRAEGGRRRLRAGAAALPHDVLLAHLRQPIGYSAGYYAYIWSEVLARDTEHWFKTNGGLTRENGDLLRQKVLSRGFSVDALTMFRDFYGKAPEIGPLLEARGLTSGTGTSGR